MEVLEPYIKILEDLVRSLPDNKSLVDKKLRIETSLNGELSKTLRELVPMKTLQESGAFFTGGKMANLLVHPFIDNINLKETVLDASCGGGNLLLAYAQSLPIQKTYRDTLLTWGDLIKGIDIHQQFVRATRARLALLIASKGLSKYGYKFFNDSIPQLKETFPHIIESNSLNEKWPKAEIVLLNPPFNVVPVPNNCKWTTGRVSQAALFMIKCLDEEELQNSKIRAILPDVLRSGPRYAKWRSEIEKKSSIEEIKILGKFDSKTNVDVFLLSLKVAVPKRNKKINWVLPQSENIQHGTSTVGEICKVNVGSVVPRRHKEIGPKYSYLDVKNLPKWVSITPGAVHRHFSGSVFKTPFVIVRRNSRSNDPNRAVGTIVRSNSKETEEYVAVENHLLVLTPKSGLLKDCDYLLKVLKDSRTNNWLNEQIRCRHLTVGSIQSIPWWSF